jgi:hypothetical protein
MTIVSIEFDQTSLAWLDELKSRLSALELVQCPVEVVQLIRDLPHGTAAFDLRSFSTGRANDYRVVLEPSDALLNLMATLRTFDRDRNSVSEARHINPSS